MSTKKYTLLVGGYEGKIHTVRFTAPTSGETSSSSTLEITSTIDCGAAPTWLTLSDDGKKVYSLDEWAEPEGELTVLTVGKDGQLTKGASTSTGGLWPCHSCYLPATTSTPGRIVTSNYKGASISVVPVASSGDLDVSHSLSNLISVDARTPGPHPDRQQQDHPHGAHVDPRGRMVVVPDLGTDDLRIFGIKQKDGSLEQLEPLKLNPGDGPRHVLFSKSGERLYVINELDNSLSVVKVDYPSSSSSSSSSRYPSLSLLQQTLSILPDSPMSHQRDFSTWHCAELVLSPDEGYLYATNRAEPHDPLGGTRQGPQDFIAIFKVDERDGTLVRESRKLVRCGGRAPRHFSLSSESIQHRDVEEERDGRWMAVSCHDSNDLIMFERRGFELKEVARLEGCGRPAIAVWL